MGMERGFFYPYSILKKFALSDSSLTAFVMNSCDLVSNMHMLLHVFMQVLKGGDT